MMTPAREFCVAVDSVLRYNLTSTLQPRRNHGSHAVSRAYVFGDVHGCYRELVRLMDRIGPDPDDRVISVGDFVDRGPNSPACTAFVMHRESVMGNHEYKHVRGIMSPAQLEARAQFHEFGEPMGVSYVSAVNFMAGLPFYLELDDAIIVHGGLEHGIPMDAQDPLVLVGGMSRRAICGIDEKTNLPYWCDRYPRTAKPVVFGHLRAGSGLPSRDNLFPLDTGCVAGGSLTAVSIPDFRVYQVRGRGR